MAQNQTPSPTPKLQRDRPILWVTITVVAIIFTIFQLKITMSEVKKRKHPSTDFLNERFRLFSITCILSGLILMICWCFTYVPFICIIITAIVQLFTVSQSISMGFYQLARMYYCFANTQIHHDKGYFHVHH